MDRTTELNKLRDSIKGLGQRISSKSKPHSQVQQYIIPSIAPSHLPRSINIKDFTFQPFQDRTNSISKLILKENYLSLGNQSTLNNKKTSIMESSIDKRYYVQNDYKESKQTTEQDVRADEESEDMHWILNWNVNNTFNPFFQNYLITLNSIEIMNSQ